MIPCGRAALLAFVVGTLTIGASRPASVWFRGDFETGKLDGWIWDRPRVDSIQVVTQPVRKGHHAVRVTLMPGDISASKERVELKVGDKEIERVHGGPGGEIWYGWSVLIPADYVDPPEDHFQILAQWHHRPTEGAKPGEERAHHVNGPPPLTLHLDFYEQRHVLSLIGRTAPKVPRRTLGALPVRKGSWIDLVFHIRWSTGSDGFVEAWMNGKPLTPGKVRGATLFSPVSNYLRIGLYRGMGVPTTNHVFIDEVRIGDSYQAVAP